MLTVWVKVMIVALQMSHPLARVQLHGVFYYALTAFQAPLRGDGGQMNWGRASGSFRLCFFYLCWRQFQSDTNHPGLREKINLVCNSTYTDIHCVVCAQLLALLMFCVMSRRLTRTSQTTAPPRADCIMAQGRHSNGKARQNSISWLFCYDCNYSMSTWHTGFHLTQRS